MMEFNHVILWISKLSVLTVLFSSTQILAKTCPGNDMPKTVQAVYVKYKITDEVYIKLNKQWGAPSNVVGDELKELILWKNYRWKRRFGKYWSTDDEKEVKYQDAHLKKWESIELRQSKGVEVPMDEIDKLAIEYMNHRPEQKVYEYDWIDVDTPEYSLYYNRSNEKGYGVLGRQLTKSDRKRLDKRTRSQLDNWLGSNYKDTKKILGIEKISKRKSKILGYDVVCETIRTSVKDFSRTNDQIEFCKANISGFEVDLYSKAGKTGQQHIMQAVEVNTAYSVNKDIFCAPGYVKLRTP